MDVVHWGGHGDLRYCGIRFFSCGISVLLILTCGIAVSSSSAVCIILANGIRRNKIVHGITVLFICAFLSIQCAKQNTVGHKGQYLEDLRHNGKWLHHLWVILWQLMIDNIQFDCCCIQWKWVASSYLTTLFDLCTCAGNSRSYTFSHNGWGPGGGTSVFFGWVCAALDSKLAPRSKNNFP